METKIQLKHPAGKNAVRLDIEKYEVLKNAILLSLKDKQELSHSEILQSIEKNFAANDIKFEGSIEWYMQSIKMDLEAKCIISKSGKSPAKYILVECIKADNKGYT